jgi:transposase
MRQIREVLRLAQAKNLTPTQIAIAAHLPRTTVRSYLSRAAAAGLSWPLPDDLDDRGLEERLFGRPAPPPAIPARPVPDWALVHAELRRPGVTQALLWTEYRERHPDGFGYTWS